MPLHLLRDDRLPILLFPALTHLRKLAQPPLEIWVVSALQQGNQFMTHSIARKTLVEDCFSSSRQVWLRLVRYCSTSSRVTSSNGRTMCATGRREQRFGFIGLPRDLSAEEDLVLLSGGATLGAQTDQDSALQKSRGKAMYG